MLGRELFFTQRGEKGVPPHVRVRYNICIIIYLLYYCVPVLPCTDLKVVYLGRYIE